MRTGWSTQRVKLETRMFVHTLYDLAGVEVFFFNLGPRALEMLLDLCFLNPALLLPIKLPFIS